MMSSSPGLLARWSAPLCSRSTLSLLLTSSSSGYLLEQWGDPVRSRRTSPTPPPTLKGWWGGVCWRGLPFPRGRATAPLGRNLTAGAEESWRGTRASRISTAPVKTPLWINPISQREDKQLLGQHQTEGHRP